MRTLATTAALALLATSHAAEDILLTDFESDSFAPWIVEGTAFGSGPAPGAVSGQMAVAGFRGDGFANSFHGGDDATGTLTSPPFTIERPIINFLIGGGGWADETCIDLEVGGLTVRTATGPNTAAGGSENLGWHSWDVAEYAGEEARLRIIDQRQGGWGHINIDHITQSENRLQALPATRTFTAEQRYLHLPVKTGNPKTRLKLLGADGRSLRELDIELAAAGDVPSLTAALELAPWKGQELTLDAGPIAGGAETLASLTQSESLPGADGIYREQHRPLFHFTSKIGWLNDPNGLVYQDGTWHLYYQHNPYGWNWGNMHWGSAISSDLLRWEELGDAIFPWSDCVGAAFSGCAVIDHQNTSGFGTGDTPPLVAALTDTGAGEVLAYSLDNGRTLTMYEGNPVIEHRGRDPKIIWHGPTERWVMALYDEFEDKRWNAFYSSPDLKEWTLESRLEGYFECPDLFELPVDGDPAKTRWVTYAADTEYAIGSFDGKTFTPDHGGKHRVWHGSIYAAQTYDNSPDGRRIQIGWERIDFPGMPFNQQMSVPVQLTLHETPDGIRMRANPVAELATLHGAAADTPDLALTDATEQIHPGGDALDISLAVAPREGATATLRVRDLVVTYDVARSELTAGDVRVPLPLVDGAITLRILADRGSFEIFANDGAAAIVVSASFDPESSAVAATAAGGTAEFADIRIRPVRSVWE